MIDDVRKGTNEDEFRELNERLEARAASRAPQDEVFQIVCECDREECTSRIEFSVSAYEAVRRRPTAFIVLSGHADPTTERLISSAGGYEIVEKFGEAGLIAAANDPRQDESPANDDND